MAIDRRARPKNEILLAIGRCREHFAPAAMYSAGINLLYLAPSIYMLQLYDRVLGSGSEATLMMLSVALFLALGTMAALDSARAMILIRAGVRIDATLSKRVLSALIERGVYPGGAQHGQALRDLDTFRQVITGPGIHAVFDAPWIPIYIAVTFMLHPLQGSVAVVGALVLVVLALANEYATRRALRRANLSAINSYQVTEATLRNAEVIQAMGMQPGLTARWARDRAGVIGYQALSSDRAAFFQSLIKFVRMGLQSGMLALGAWLVLERQISPGGMFASTILLGRALAPIEQLVGGWKQFVQAIESFRRVSDLLAVQPPRPTGMTLPTPEGALSVEKLFFAPGPNDKPILKGISFNSRPGESIGVVGPSAAGKSTLARLIVGVWRPSAGYVRLDGADVYTWDRVEFGRHVGYLPQDIELFSGTVRENISRFSESQPEMVVDAARLAGVHEMILRLPKGYDTDIGEGGAILSGGQRQRLGLARALFGRPRLLILDEPNSNLDSEGEQALVAALAQLKANGTTMLIIAHRPSILGCVDKMMVLRDGIIEMFGPRNEVLAKLTPNVVRPAAFAGGGAAPGLNPPRDH